MEKNRTALLLGASGLVGSHVLKFLLNSEMYSSVKVLGRRELPTAGLSGSVAKLQKSIIDFTRLPDFAPLFTGDDLFCCLGTTIKKAKTQEAFYQVDFTYSFLIAKLAREHGVKRLFLVSSVGADAKSKIFYSEVKGKLEDAVTQLQFPETHIFRPSVLLGQRDESRPLEEISTQLLRPLSGLFVGPLRKYRPIPAESVARAMVSVAEKNNPGHFIYDSETIAQLSALTSPLTST